MESWAQGTPVLVHGDCAVTHQHATRSGGGLAFTDYDEFASAMTRLLDHPDDAQRMGGLGRQYVVANYQWPAIVAKYQEVIAEVSDAL
jgi:glycosyltransferase involved in cell wall biosynthesis